MSEQKARAFLEALNRLCHEHDVSMTACSCCEGINVELPEGCLSNVYIDDESVRADWCPSGNAYERDADWELARPS